MDIQRETWSLVLSSRPQAHRGGARFLNRELDVLNWDAVFQTVNTDFRVSLF